MAERINLDDPNADLLGLNEDELSEEEFLCKQLYEKTPKRINAISDLWYDEMIEAVDGLEIPEEEKRKMIFNMTAHSVLDMINDSSPDEIALEVSFCFDMFVGVSLTNKRFGVSLIKELKKALLDMKRDDFPDDDTYQREMIAFEEMWWDLPQPLLDKRTPNDAIKETLAKYGLTE
ncbi:MAG: hypothetical protein FWC44_03385 [Methanomassiliicoccaceae archaeon]|nr:hypothetical protein [Methanomassiliicoccaceae archaeon]MCL2318081.1 hypothetical protein [Methanomassiliicoccaceae archaeon]